MSYEYDLRKTLMIVLILLWDRSLSSIFFNCFYILFHNSIALTVIEYRYITFSVGYSLLPHNFIVKSSSSFVCLDLKITISVFLD